MSLTLSNTIFVMAKGGIELLMSFPLLEWYMFHCSGVLPQGLLLISRRSSLNSTDRMVRLSIYMAHAHILSHLHMVGVISGVLCTLSISGVLCIHVLCIRLSCILCLPIFIFRCDQGQDSLESFIHPAPILALLKLMMKTSSYLCHIRQHTW